MIIRPIIELIMCFRECRMQRRPPAISKGRVLRYVPHRPLQRACLKMPYPEIVVAGCGNLLFADDGFGPAVAQELLKFALPDNVKVVDAGICAAPFVFTLLDPERTKKLIIVDIVDFGAVSGAIARQHPRCPSRGHRRSAPAYRGRDRRHYHRMPAKTPSRSRYGYRALRGGSKGRPRRGAHRTGDRRGG